MPLLRALDRAGLAVDDIALWEINEAFASAGRPASSASTKASSTCSQRLQPSGIRWR